jgi:hypothetical protein
VRDKGRNDFPVEIALLRAGPDQSYEKLCS